MTDVQGDIEDFSAKYQMTIDKLEAIKQSLVAGEWVEGWTLQKADDDIDHMKKSRDATLLTLRELAAELDIDV